MDWDWLFGRTKGVGVARFDPSDVPELEQAIDFILGEPDLRSRISGFGTSVDDPETSVARQTLWQGLLVAEAAPLLKGLSHHESSTDDPGGEEAPHRVVRVAG
jgi:hypothetical protein